MQARSTHGADGFLLAARAAHADQQRDPELKALLQRIIVATDCFADKYESEVWYKSMEPRLAKFVPLHEARLEILDHVYCEAKRDPTVQLPPDLVLALMEVESRFDRWAVSPAGAVGLMQVMPFWPRELGVQNQLVKVAPNIRMGCEILRYYLKLEHRNWSKALARYNGSVGRNTYPALVMQRWERSGVSKRCYSTRNSSVSSLPASPTTPASSMRSTRACDGPRKPRSQCRQITSRPACRHLNRTVGKITSMPAQSQTLGLYARAVSEIHALHSAEHPQTKAALFHRE